jgi:hypothetical protein
MARTTDFLAAIPWAQVVFYCGDYSDNLAPERQQFLAGFVDAMLRRTGPAVPSLAAMIADPEMNPACQGAVAKFISARRDSFLQREDCEQLGRAFFALAESGTRPPRVTFDSYAAAAMLWGGEPVMRRAMADARAPEAEEFQVQQGIEMLGNMRDGRATDSLQTVLAEFVAAERFGKPLAKGVMALAYRGGPSRFGFLHGIFQRRPLDHHDTLCRGLLLAMARTGSPAAYPVILEIYADQASGIADSTWAFKGVDKDRYSFYYWLWESTWAAEPSIIAALQADAPEAYTAVELLDRASRFGLPASGEGLLRPLLTWGERHGEPWQARTALIAKRFRSYPDQRQFPDRIQG